MTPVIKHFCTVILLILLGQLKDPNTFHDTKTEMPKIPYIKMLKLSTAAYNHNVVTKIIKYIEQARPCQTAVDY